MRFRETCDRTRARFEGLTPQMRVRLSVIVLLGLAFALEPEARRPLWAFRHIQWEMCAGVLLAGLMGVAVSRTKSPAVRFRLNVAAFALVACLTSWELVPGGTLAWLSIGYLPLIMLAIINRERAPTFVLGFLLATMAISFHSTHFTLGVFLLARDFDQVSAVAERQSIALLSCGLMTGLFVFSLSFDIAATIEYDPAFEGGFERGFDGVRGFIGDAPIPRWTRMLTEALLIMACLAQLRGRTWGILALALLLPALAFQVRGAGIELPFWSSAGWFSARHPLRDTVLEKSIALLAIGPWLWPMLRSLWPRATARVE